MSTRYLEDYSDGEVIVTAPYRLGRDELIDFARLYDPQPMHIDEDYAKGPGPFPDVIASGFQTVAICFKLFAEMGFFEGDVALGGPGMDEVRWLAPVFADDVLTNHATVLEARRSRSKPDRGLIRVKHDLRNQAGASVVTCITVSMIRCRDVPPAA
jgi:acyl dehydratase